MSESHTEIKAKEILVKLVTHLLVDKPKDPVIKIHSSINFAFIASIN